MLPSPHAPGSSAFGSSRFALLLALIALVLAIPVSASEYTVYLDTDDDASTGCTVSTVDGDFFGAESATTTTVDDMTLEVTSVEMAMCNGGAFDPPVTLADFVTPWNVGLDAGVSGAEVVESYVPFADVRTACVRAAITSDDGSGGLDAILNTTGLPGGSEIRFGNCGSIVEIPTADSVGLTILALLLAIAAGLALRRHPTALVWIVFVISASAALVGVVQAAPGNVFFLDGDPTEWLGNTQFQVGDPAGDVGSNADLIAAFFGYSVDDQTLFVRFDYSGPSAPPTAVDDVATVAEDAAATTIDVQANDTDPDGGPNSVLSVTQPADGTVVITNSGADLTYQPDPDYCNDGTPTDDFTYTLNGGSSATVAVTVTCIDDPPTAVDDTATVAEDAAATAIDVLMNDTDADGGTILVQSVTQPTDGTVVITGGGIGLTYQPDADFCNDGTPTDDFTYTLNGGSTATVAVTVTCDDDPPTAVDDTATVLEDAAATAIDVLMNDTDADGGTILVQSVTQPTDGTVVITGGGTGLTYQPDADFCNDGTPTDDFTYTLNGGSTATVAVTVTCVNDEPVFTAGADETVAEDAGAQTVNGWATGIDDGDAEATQMLTFTVTNDDNALFSQQPDVDETTGDLTYTSAMGASGSATVSVFLMDDGGTANSGDDTSPTQMFTITVTDVDNPPTCTTTAGITAFTEDGGAVAVDSGITVADSDSANLVSATVTITNLLDAGLENLAASVGGTSIVANYVAPTLSLTGSDTLANYQAVLQSLTYNNSSNDPDETSRIISCVVNDGTTASAAANKTVSVAEVNDPPTVTSPTIDYNVVGNTLLRVDSADADNHDMGLPERVASTTSLIEALAAAGASDPDSPAPVFVAEVAETTDQGGLLTLDDDGDLHYLPPIGFTGTDTESVVITDGEGGNVPVTLRFTVAEMIWYVEDTIGAKNPAGNADGRSTDAFQTLAAVEAASGAGDTILLFETDAPLNETITLKSGQKFYGQRVEEEPISLLPTGLLLEEIADTNARPQVRRTGGVAVNVTSAGGAMANVEIRHLDLDSGDTDAIEVNISGANPVTNLLIDENIIGSDGARGIDLNSAPTSGQSSVSISDNQVDVLTDGIDVDHTTAGSLVLTIDGNQILRAGARGISVSETAGTVTVVSLDGNSVAGGSGGDGMVFEGVTFDADESTPAYEMVDANNTTIGSAGNGVGGMGLVISNGSGDLLFDDLDIEGAAGILATGSGVVNVGAGTGFRLTTAAGSSVVATGGPALDLDPMTAALVFDSIMSSSSATTGVALADIEGSVALNGGSISGAAGTAFDILRGSAVVTYAGTIGNTAGRSVSVASRPGGSANFSGNISDTGTGILVNANTGGTTTFSAGTKTINTGANAAVTLTTNTGHTVAFTNGGLDIDTTSGNGFVATGGGTINVGTGGSANSVTSTAGKAIDIDGVTTGITFASLSSTGSGSEGVDITALANTSSFTVTGTTSVTTATNAGIRLSSAVGAGVDIDFTGTTTVDDAGGEGIRVDRTGAGSDVDFGTVNIQNRNATGVLFDNLAGTMDFGATSIPNPDLSTGYGIRVEDSAAAVTFASTTISDTSVGTAGTYDGTRGLPTNEGDGDAIFLIRNLPASFGFTVNGGTIDDFADNAIDIRDSRNIVLDGVTIDGNGAGNSAVQGHDVHNFTLRDAIIREVGNDANAAPLVGDHGMRFAELEGNLIIQRSQLIDSTGYVLANASAGSANRAVELDNRQGCNVADMTGDCNLTATITGSTFRGWDFQGVNLRKVGGTLDMDVDGTTADGANTFQNINGAAVNAGPAQAALAHNHTLDVIGNTFTTVGIGVELFSTRGGPTVATVNDNNITSTIADGVRLVAFNQAGGGPSATFTGSVRDNTISDVAIATPGSGGGAGVFVAAEDGVVAKVLIDNNDIDGIAAGDVAEALRTQNQRGGNLDVVWSNNTLVDFPTNFFGAVYIGNDNTAPTNTCVVFDDNMYTNTNGLFANTYAFDTVAPAVIALEGFMGGMLSTFLGSVEANGPFPELIFGAAPVGAACDITPLPRP